MIRMIWTGCFETQSLIVYYQHFMLNKKSRIRLSQEVRDAVKNIYLVNKAYWMVSEHHLKRILNVFYQAHIDVIPLKGGILQSELYRDNGIRSMQDIDILVRPGEFLYSVNLLIQCGLTCNRKNNLKFSTTNKTSLCLLAV